MAVLRRSQKLEIELDNTPKSLAHHKTDFEMRDIPQPKPLSRKILFEEEFVRKFAKKDGKKQTRIEGYKIERDLPENYSCGYGRIFGNRERKLQYYDNTDAIVLTKEDEAVAFCSYSNNNGIVTISQIQGTYGKGNELKGLHWAKALIRAIEEMAKKCGVKKIIIRSAKNAQYPEIKGNSNPGEAGFTIYDVNARRCKFKKNEETGDYEKELQEGI